MTNDGNGSFAGKVALVTGGGSGIGEACCKLFAARGARVVVVDLKLEAAQKVESAIAASGGEATAVAANVADPAAAEAMVKAAVDRFGRLDVAVNNAGIGGPQALTGDYPLEGWQQVIDVNLSGVFYCMRAELGVMVPAGRGAIINMASILGSVAAPNSPAYVAAKHGVVGLTKAAALEYATSGIRINSIGPGYIATPLLDENLDAATLEALTKMHPVQRLGSAEEVAALVCFLASDEASFITGSYHLVDGGYTAQ